MDGETLDIINNIKINSDLKNEIICDMPSNFSLVEKAIYIYIKMCKVLTYDEEFYVFNQETNVQLKHLDMRNLTKITPDNNKVVCYEFNAIYAKFLYEIGITDFELLGISGMVFNGRHQKLNFTVDEYEIEADSTTSSINGDMNKAKLNSPLVGLKCRNIDEKLIRKFNMLISKVYSIIVRQELEKLGKGAMYVDLSVDNYMIHGILDDARMDLLEKASSDLSDEEFDKLSEKDYLKRRINSYIEILSNCNLSPIDTMHFPLALRNVAFTELEKKTNIIVSYVKDNEEYAEGKEAGLSAIITTSENNVNYNKDSNDNNYFYFIPGKGVIKISKQEIIDKLKNGKLEQMEDEYLIPGISSCDDSKINL